MHKMSSYTFMVMWSICVQRFKTLINFECLIIICIAQESLKRPQLYNYAIPLTNAGRLEHRSFGELLCVVLLFRIYKGKGYNAGACKLTRICLLKGTHFCHFMLMQYCSILMRTFCLHEECWQGGLFFSARFCSWLSPCMHWTSPSLNKK